MGEQGNIGKISKGTREHEPIFRERGNKTVQISPKQFDIRNRERHLWDFIYGHLCTTVIGFVYFTQDITRTQTKSRLSAGSLGRRVPESQVGGNLLSPIAKMVGRSFADHVVLPVTAAIYRNGQEKPAMRWPFEMGIGGESGKMLFDFIFLVREGFGIADRCCQLNIYSEIQSV